MATADPVREQILQETVDKLLKQNTRKQEAIDRLKGESQQQKANARMLLKALERKEKRQESSQPAQTGGRRQQQVDKALHKKVDALGEAVKDIHSQTTPAIPWLPSIIISILLVYPAQEMVKDTAKDYKISAWASGLLIDTQQATSSWAIKWGIESVGGTTAYTPPLSGKLIVTSPFDPSRKHPVTGLVRPHNGVDYRCAVGTPVYAMQSGVIASASYEGNAGNMIAIKHSSGETSIYMHLDTMSVGYGEKVSTGEKIGTCGATGRVTGPHLHVGIMKANGQYIDPVTVIGIASSADMWEYFKDTIASSESAGAGDYGAVSRSGTFLGRYQMDLPTIAYAGFPGVTRKQFMVSPAMQDRVYKSWQAKNLSMARNGINVCESRAGKLIKASTPSACIKNDGIWSFIPGFINSGTPAYKVSGFMHAAQFGPVHAMRWYSQSIEFKDGNGKRISEYASRGESAFLAKYGRFASSGPLFNAIENGMGPQSPVVATEQKTECTINGIPCGG